MAWLDFLFGKKGGIEQVPTMSSEQQQLLSQLLSNLGGISGQGLNYLQDLLSGSPEAYEAPAMRQFQEEIIPGIAERFTSMGAGSQGSSAFGQQLGAAGAGLAERLAMQRAGLKQSALSQLQGLLGQGLGAKSFESVYRPSSTGFLGSMIPGIGQTFGLGLGTGLTKLLGII